MLIENLIVPLTQIYEPMEITIEYTTLVRALCNRMLCIGVSNISFHSHSLLRCPLFQLVFITLNSHLCVVKEIFYDNITILLCNI